MLFELIYVDSLVLSVMSWKRLLKPDLEEKFILDFSHITLAIQFNFILVPSAEWWEVFN